MFKVNIFSVEGFQASIINSVPRVAIFVEIIITQSYAIIFKTELENLQFSKQDNCFLCIFPC